MPVEILSVTNERRQTFASIEAAQLLIDFFLNFQKY